MSKIDDAIARITDECEKNKHLVPLEEYLTSICTTDAIAEKILSKDKTLKGCLGYMSDIAKKRAVSGFCAIPDSEGFEIIEAYYDITDADKEKSPVEPTPGKIIDILNYM